MTTLTFYPDALVGIPTVTSGLTFSRILESPFLNRLSLR